MAALPLCTSWFPPSGAVASHSARPRPGPASRVTQIRSLGRRVPSPLPIRIQARTRASRLRCTKAADRDHHGLEPQPKPERGDDAAASTEIPFVDTVPWNSYDIPEILEQRKFRKAFCAAWLPREARDMFCIEKDEISNYMRISSRANFQDVNNKVLALFVCAEAQEALDLASMVMDLTYVENLDRRTIHLFDQHTADQVIRTCASIFCHVAKAAYLKRVETDTAILFLDALRGLGVFCDTLFQQIVFELKDGPLKNSINNTMGIHSRKFGKEMKRLKEQFMQSMDATGIKHTAVMDTLSHGMKHAQVYILQMILAQEYARRNLAGSIKA